MRRYRRGLQVGLLMVIAAFIASLFVFGQRGFGDGAGRDAVATVNGESIPLARYQQRYQAFMEAYARIYRDRFSPELAERLGLPQQVVNELIQEALIVQRAGAEGLLVTDEELNAQIQAVPAFQESGRFALKRYQEYVRRRGLAAAAFENEMRRELTRMKVEQAVRGGVKVTPAEVEHAFVLRREEARAAWALVEFGPLIAAASASDDELGKYLGAHQDEFRQPERRRILSVTLTPKDFLKPVADAAVEQYYREHPKEFEEPRRVHAAHVLARVPETGGSEAEDRARAKVADVIRRAKAGEDFAKLAKETSEDPGSAPKGGDLGWVRAGEMVPQFEQALFALKKGAMSPEPVRSPFGFHAIRVLEVREGGRKPLKDVAAQIQSRLQTEATEKAMQARAEAIRRELLAAQDFMAEAREGGGRGARARHASRRGGEGRRLPRGGEEGKRRDGGDVAVLAGEARGEAARRRDARGAPGAARRRHRAGEGPAGLLRAPGARARGAGPGRPGGRARPGHERGARAEAKPGVGVLAQRGAREREGRGPRPADVGRARHVRLDGAPRGRARQGIPLPDRRLRRGGAGPWEDLDPRAARADADRQEGRRHGDGAAARREEDLRDPRGQLP